MIKQDTTTAIAQVRFIRELVIVHVTIRLMTAETSRKTGHPNPRLPDLRAAECEPNISELRDLFSCYTVAGTG